MFRKAIITGYLAHLAVRHQSMSSQHVQMSGKKKNLEGWVTNGTKFILLENLQLFYSLFFPSEGPMVFYITLTSRLSNDFRLLASKSLNQLTKRRGEVLRQMPKKRILFTTRDEVNVAHSLRMLLL